MSIINPGNAPVNIFLAIAFLERLPYGGESRDARSETQTRLGWLPGVRPSKRSVFACPAGAAKSSAAPGFEGFAASVKKRFNVWQLLHQREGQREIFAAGEVRDPPSTARRSNWKHARLDIDGQHATRSTDQAASSG